jgi:hypothetical protein
VTDARRSDGRRPWRSPGWLEFAVPELDRDTTGEGAEASTAWTRMVSVDGELGGLEESGVGPRRGLRQARPARGDERGDGREARLRATTDARRSPMGRGSRTAG